VPDHLNNAQDEHGYQGRVATLQGRKHISAPTEFLTEGTTTSIWMGMSKH
jgi:hypothetical protein